MSLYIVAKRRVAATTTPARITVMWLAKDARAVAARVAHTTRLKERRQSYHQDEIDLAVTCTAREVQIFLERVGRACVCRRGGCGSAGGGRAGATFSSDWTPRPPPFNRVGLRKKDCLKTFISGSAGEDCQRATYCAAYKFSPYVERRSLPVGATVYKNDH